MKASLKKLTKQLAAVINAQAREQEGKHVVIASAHALPRLDGLFSPLHGAPTSFTPAISSAADLSSAFGSRVLLSCPTLRQQLAAESLSAARPPVSASAADLHVARLARDEDLLVARHVGGVRGAGAEVDQRRDLLPGRPALGHVADRAAGRSAAVLLAARRDRHLARLKGGSGAGKSGEERCGEEPCGAGRSGAGRGSAVLCGAV